MRRLLYVGGLLVILLMAGYFVVNALIRRKVEASLRTLPSSIKATYGSLHADVLTGSLVLQDLSLSQNDGGREQHLSIEKVTVHGINYFALASSGNNVTIGRLELTGIRVEEHKRFSMEGDLALDSLHIPNLDKPTDDIQIGAIRLNAKKLSYLIPGTFEAFHLSGLTMDSKGAFLRIDTVRVIPTVGKLELGGIKGHQVDYVEASCEGFNMERVDLKGLLQHRLIADKISLQHNNISVFRDRRLPMQTDKKPLPMDYLKSLPLTIRIQQVSIGTSTFSYEEFPKKGNKTGVLRIVRLRGTIKPLINHPMNGDPNYIIMTTEGSLMGSGTVTATTKVPLHKGDPYKVEGTFHELDVTRLNPSAENLGGLHLESGMLNSLAFAFEMNEEKATGRIIGEYHDLVVDKLRGLGDDKKVDKVKSFFLKRLIIPKDKDHTLPESKRTGKVDYKHDPERYFSYYLLHALLVGVKSSFSLGFLLPG